MCACVYTWFYASFFIYRRRRRRRLLLHLLLIIIIHYNLFERVCLHLHVYRHRATHIYLWGKDGRPNKRTNGQTNGRTNEMRTIDKIERHTSIIISNCIFLFPYLYSLVIEGPHMPERAAVAAASIYDLNS